MSEVPLYRSQVLSKSIFDDDSRVGCRLLSLECSLAGCRLLQGLLKIKDTHCPIGWSSAPRTSPTVGPYGVRVLNLG